MIPRRIFWLFDALVLAAAFTVAYRLVPSLVAFFVSSGISHQAWVIALSPAGWTGQLPPLSEMIWILAAMVPATVLFLEIFGSYRSVLAQARTPLVVGAFLAPFIGLSIITLALYAARNPAWSRLFIYSFALLSGLGLAGYRIILRQYITLRQAAGYYTKNVVVIGLPTGAAYIARHLAQKPHALEYRLIGWLSPIPGPLEADSDLLALPLLGEVGVLGELLIHNPVHEVIVVYPNSGGDWIKQVLQHCDYFRVGVRVVPEALLFADSKDLQVLYHSEPLQLPAVVLQPPHLNSDRLFLKRLIDIFVSAVLLVVLFPLFALIALAIKITTPELPIFYPWRVVGCKGVEFTGYKFSTMQRDADERKTELMAQNEMTGPVFKIKKDPRVTPLGRFLRKYSLNELPQLWSVLKGEMSLVGPRPAGPHELQRYELWQKRKLSIRPGITCLWQVRGRNEISNFDDWVKMDLEYIDHWSLWLDFKVLVWTARAVISGTGS